MILKRNSTIFSALLVLSLLLAACGPFGGDDNGDEEGDVPEQPEETTTEEDGEEATPEGEDEEDGEEATPEGEDEGTPEDDETPEEVSEELSGEQLYNRECAACHGEDGEGNERMGSSIPAHNGNGLVTADEPAGVISVLLTGRGGMPRFDGILSDEELAEVITYMRGAWDNDASAVEPEEIDEVRQDVIGSEGEDDEDEQGEEGEEGDDTQGAGDQEEDDAEASPTEEGDD